MILCSPDLSTDTVSVGTSDPSLQLGHRTEQTAQKVHHRLGGSSFLTLSLTSS